MSARLRGLVSILTGALLVLLMAPLVGAMHSLPTIPTYQDVGNDGYADPATTLRTAGNDSYWTAAREDRVTYAASQWRVYSQFDPSANLTAAPADCFDSLTCHGVWIDGQDGGIPFQTGEKAHNITKVVLREHPSLPLFLS